MTAARMRRRKNRRTEIKPFGLDSPHYFMMRMFLGESACPQLSANGLHGRDDPLGKLLQLFFAKGPVLRLEHSAKQQRKVFGGDGLCFAQNFLRCEASQIGNVEAANCVFDGGVGGGVWEQKREVAADSLIARK